DQTGLPDLTDFSKAIKAAHDDNTGFQNRCRARYSLSSPGRPGHQITENNAQEKREHHGIQMEHVETPFPVQLDPRLGVLSYDNSGQEEQREPWQNRKKAFQGF